VWVKKVSFEPGKVVVRVALGRHRLHCPLCGPYHAPQAVICTTPTTSSSSPQGARRGRRAYWNELRSLGDQDAARRFKDARSSLLKKPEKLADEQAATLARPKAAGGEVWRAYPGVSSRAGPSPRIGSQ
jgi:hypothetical protein